VRAQAPAYARALAEVRAGHKQSHWMWFVFPQIDGLGSSPMAREFAIKSLDEARAYLEHPVLGPRLFECMQAALGVAGRSAYQIFGSPDDLKLHSCATLFALVSRRGSVFEHVLDRYFKSKPDPKTLRILKTTYPLPPSSPEAAS